MSRLPRRLPPTPDERLKIILSQSGSAVSGSTRFEGPVNPNPTASVKETNKVYVQEEEPINAEVGDLWVKPAPPPEPEPDPYYNEYGG